MRVVIAEDTVLLREGLAGLLEDAGHEVVGRARDADEAIAAVRKQQPDLAILDITMPPRHADDGARAARILKDDYPGLGILLLSQHIESQYSIDLMTRGGFGYLLKDRVFDVGDFLDALRRVASGGSALDPEVVRQLINPGRDRRLGLLTARESDVLGMMAQGLTNVGIARRLCLSPRTVETHVGNIISKLGLAESEEEHRRVLAVLTYLGRQAS